MPRTFRRHPAPPKQAFISKDGDKIVKSIIHQGREYWLHPTKGWRSGKVRV